MYNDTINNIRKRMTIKHKVDCPDGNQRDFYISTKQFNKNAKTGVSTFIKTDQPLSGHVKITYGYKRRAISGKLEGNTFTPSLSGQNTNLFDDKKANPSIERTGPEARGIMLRRLQDESKTNRPYDVTITTHVD